MEGREHVPDGPGIILASNHLSITDPILLDVVIDGSVGRNVRYMAKAEARSMPVLGWLLQRYGGFFVRRGQADREAYRMARAVLDGGDWLGLAPEGTRSRTGQLGEAKPGVVLLATRAGAMVLPVAIWGSEKLWPIGARLPRPGTTVHIRFGEPYRPAEGPAGGAPDARAASPDGAASGSAEPAGAARPESAPAGREAGASRSARRRDALEASTEELMGRIAALLPPEYRGRYG